MFSKALRQVERFTRPVIISTKLYSGKVESVCGAFIILNSEGWVLTANHIIEPLLIYQKHLQEIAQYEKAREQLNSNISLSPARKKKEIAKFGPNPKWITNISYWWSKDGVNGEEIKCDALRDIAVARLKPFDPLAVRSFPIFWNPSDTLPTGKSLCRLGFPFPSVEASFDFTKNHFTIAPDSFQIPLFPFEGMHTRVKIVETQDSSKSAMFIEVSTPGLRGQSGGPVFDVEGRVCGIQSHTSSLPLGFTPEIEHGGHKTVENQFINVGFASHVKEILDFLRDNKIKVTVSPRFVEGPVAL